MVGDALRFLLVPAMMAFAASTDLFTQKISNFVPATLALGFFILAALDGIGMAEVAITSAAVVVEGEGPPEAFRLDEVPGVAVEPRRAEGRKCARSWKILPSVGSDPDYPDVSPRDAQALREWDGLRHAAQ